MDSLRLAETISREAEKKGVTVPILIEVNIAGEETKFGLSSNCLLYTSYDFRLVAYVVVLTIIGILVIGSANRDVYKRQS